MRRGGQIPRQWSGQDIRDALVRAGYSKNSVNTIPFNQSISRDGKVKGNYIKKGVQPVAYRISPGIFELIDEAGPKEQSEQRHRKGIVQQGADKLSDASVLLIRAVREIIPGKRNDLNRMKQTDRWDRADFIWEALLLSMATMGNSRGAALVHDERHHSRVTWDVLVPLTDEQRLKRLDDTLRAAKVRRPARKALWLAENFTRIEGRGGPAALKCELEKCASRDAKIAFLRAFDGIGPKYARNMLMDVYHPDFRDSIAVDERIKKVSRALGMKFAAYTDEERFYLRVAEGAGLNGWELDRLLYNFTDEVLPRILVRPSTTGT